MPTRTTLNSSALRALPRSSIRPARILPRSRVAAQPSVGASTSVRCLSGASSSSASSPSGSSNSPRSDGTNTSSTSDYSSTPDASTSILLQTLPNIPRYGFTTHAFLQAAPSSSSSIDPEESLKRSRMLSTLFPGPPSVFDSRLFTAWNTVCDLSVLHDIAPEAAIEALQKGQAVGKGVGGRPVRMQQSLSQVEEKEALEKVVQMVENRLRLSWAVRSHLTHGLTALSTTSPTTSTLHSIFPHETLLPNIPNPYPLFDLTSNFISTLLTHPSAQLRTGWIDPDGPEWYAIRTRLTLAYTAATLHAASQSVAHFQDTQRLFGRIVKARDSGLVATLEGLGKGVKDWSRWGGRGWLGVFRSLGL